MDSATGRDRCRIGAAGQLARPGRELLPGQPLPPRWSNAPRRLMQILDARNLAPPEKGVLIPVSFFGKFRRSTQTTFLPL